MIITKLMGGLGNQLFQYAAGRSLAYINNTILKLDISWFSCIHDSNTTPRNYGLDKFNIIEDFASPEEIHKFKKNKIHMVLEMLKPYRFRSFMREQKFNLESFNDIKFNPKFFKLSDNVYIQGYWQTEKYFKNIESIIRKEITLKKTFTNQHEELINKTNSVAIHIRRGDKVKEIRGGACSLDYYYAASKKIINTLISPYFFIFSDDIKWVKDNLKLDYPITFVSGTDIKDYEELILMSKCKHHIIANSAFSWWGAWLNSNPNKIVIAPQKWFNDSSINTKDLIPESWIKI